MPRKRFCLKAFLGGLCLAGTLHAEPNRPHDHYNPARFRFVGIELASDASKSNEYTSILSRLIGDSIVPPHDVFDFPNPIVREEPIAEPVTLQSATELPSTPEEPDFGFDEDAWTETEPPTTNPSVTWMDGPPEGPELADPATKPSEPVISAEDWIAQAEPEFPELPEVEPIEPVAAEETLVAPTPQPTLAAPRETEEVEQRHTKAMDALPPDPTVLPVEQASSRAFQVNAGIASQAKKLINDGIDAAERGAIYSARAQFVKVLRLISQSLDVESGTRIHSAGLASGLRALEEANDFRPGGSRLEANLDLERLVMSHRTPIFKDRDLRNLSPLAAQQAYHAYAEEQLAVAGGHELSAADALYGLGKLQGHLDVGRSDSDHQVGPTGMSLYQAALMVYPEHFMAANELGVLFARFGQLEDAQAALEHAARTDPQFPEPWLNLAKVHQRRGDQDLATLAMDEYQLRVASRQNGTRLRQAQITWVDNQTFARSGTTRAEARQQVLPPNDSSSMQNRVPPQRSVPASVNAPSQRPSVARRPQQRPQQAWPARGGQPRKGPLGWSFR